MQTVTKILLLVALTLLLPYLTYARAYFAPVDEMVRDADAIAVVKVLDVKPAKAEEQDLRYKDMMASVEVKETIKGDLANVTSVLIPNFFPCAVVDVAPGEYLLFLKRRDGVLTNSNWHLSLRTIHGDMVSWFSESKKDFSDMSVNHVRQQIEERLRAPAHEQP